MRPRTSCAPAAPLPAGPSRQMACRSLSNMQPRQCFMLCTAAKGCWAVCRRGVCEHEYAHAPIGCKQASSRQHSRASGPACMRVMSCAGARQRGLPHGRARRQLLAGPGPRAHGLHRDQAAAVRAPRSALFAAARRACFPWTLVLLAERKRSQGTCLHPVFCRYMAVADLPFGVPSHAWEICACLLGV